MELGKLGVWAPMDALTAAEGAEFAQRVEALGLFGAVDPRKPRAERAGAFVLAARQYAELIVAPGIANIYARDAMAMANGQRALAEQSDGRFLLGIGVSHPPMVAGLRGHITASRSRRCAPI